MTLIHLIYVSTAQRECSATELDAILAASVRNNQRLGITGMLLYANGSFLQVLEGEQAAVEETFERVSADGRHTGVFVIDRAPIAQRAFSDWSMGFRRLRTEDAAAHPAYAPFFEHGFDIRRIGARPGIAVELLTEFAQSQRAAAVR